MFRIRKQINPVLRKFAFAQAGVLEHIIIIALRFLQADLAISRGWPLGRWSPSPEAAGAFRLSEDNSAPGR